ncbi:MAG: MgtC/SapB family protein [Gammaproteobacteria bacterium]|nr:MgtC/SapB family protein [Gammaproteobacteria bacterium]
MNYFDPFSLPFWMTVGMAISCGGIIGLERQLRGKPAGIRTSILICLSTTIFIHLGALSSGEIGSDATRVLGQVVTGVGFLGAGVIISREGTVIGVTTAAVVWALAAIGATIGFGFYLGAIALSIVTVLVLWIMDVLEASVNAFARGAHKPPASEHSDSKGEGVK